MHAANADLEDLVQVLRAHLRQVLEEVGDGDAEVVVEFPGTYRPVAGMPVWSTLPPGDPRSIGHRMEPDAHGRPTSPVCGVSTEGFRFRRDHAWTDVPERQRCPECVRDGWLGVEERRCSALGSG